LLVAEADKMLPPRMNELIGWIAPNDPPVAIEIWQALAKALEARWLAEKDPELRHQISSPLVQVLSRIGNAELLAFLRRQLAEGPEQYRAAYAMQLFNSLVGEPWSAPIEDEAFALLERVSDAEEPADRLLAQVVALYRLTDAMVAGRNQAGLAKIEHIEQLSRKERREKTDEQMRLAREGFADRLKQELAKHRPPFTQWLTVERLYLETLTARNLAQVSGECLEALPTLAVVSRPGQPDNAAPDASSDSSQRLERGLRSRYLTTLTYLATRRGADAALIERLLKFLDERITARPDEEYWKQRK